MFVDLVFEDRLSGVHSDGIQYDVNNFDQIEESIKNLNGKTMTMVILKSTKSNKTLTIGGGENNKYIAYITVGLDDEFYNLVNNNDDCGYIDIPVGGQSGSYAKKQCLNLSMVLTAAKEFASNGKMLEKYKWEKD